MAVVVAGLNHRSVSLAVLEPMAVAPADLPKALAELGGMAHLDEVVVLSTCMRTEIYAVANRFHGAMSDIRNFLSTWSGCPPEYFGDHLYSYYDEAAVTQLFRVAAGIDSAVLGEGEVLAQVRQAWSAARVEQAAGPALEVLFRRAVEVGKRVRSETAIARGTTSLSQAAVSLAEQRLGGLAGRSVLVVGAGVMGQSLCRAVAGRPERGALLVANRTHDHAVALAAEHGGRAVVWAQLVAAMAGVDVVLASTGAAEIVVDSAALRAVAARRGGRDLLVVDVAVPRDVDPGAAGVDGVTLLDMDDLRSFAEAAMEERRKELPRAGQIVSEEVARYFEAAAQRQVAPIVSALRARAETLRLSELDRLAGRLAGLDEAQARAVDALTRGLVAKLLHDPTVNLKVAAGSARGEQLAHALQQLFDL
ncbi:MAG: glutamyl-tRNA reductase [Acidimicrobiales bacterium]